MCRGHGGALAHRHRRSQTVMQPASGRAPGGGNHRYLPAAAARGAGADRRGADARERVSIADTQASRQSRQPGAGRREARPERSTSVNGVTVLKPDMQMTTEQLQEEIQTLQARLTDTEEVLRAIRNGEIDAVMIEAQQGPQVYTL